MQTRVVNVTRTQESFLYIGRGSTSKPGLNESDWGNPIRLTWGADRKQREQCILQYAHYLYQTPYLLGRVPELYGLILGCHCAPMMCHGHFLAWLTDETHEMTVEQRGLYLARKLLDWHNSNTIPFAEYVP